MRTPVPPRDHVTFSSLCDASAATVTIDVHVLHTIRSAAPRVAITNVERAAGVEPACPGWKPGA